MILEQSKHIIDEVSKVLIGKNEIIEKVLMTIYAGGHILLEDCPGVGKTTLALGFSKAINFDYKRIQFTTDTMPSDIVGFTVYNKKTDEFDYRKSSAFCNLLLADEINRTLPKTQSALLEVMEEKKVTVDGVTHELPKPFICIATQNPYGSSGTHPLPESQLDRFMVKLSIGYPSTNAQIGILKSHRYYDPLKDVKQVVTKESILDIQNYISSINISDNVLLYITNLCEATRNEDFVEYGISPRGVLALSKMSRARALLKDRNYVVPEDVQDVFYDVCAHRLILKPQSRIEGIDARHIIDDVLNKVPVK